MAATLSSAPGARAYAMDPIWIEATTDIEPTEKARIELSVADPGATAGQTLRIQWSGNDVTFTVAVDTPAATELPLRSEVSTQLEYSNLIAERLRQNEAISNYFTIEVTAGATDLITIRQRHLEVVEIVVTNTLSNIDEVVYNVSALFAVDNLRALVEVWSNTGSTVNDTKLLALHAPYAIEGNNVELVISPAFAQLEAHLPNSNTIRFPTGPSVLNFGDATRMYQSYYLRLADKYGTPPVAEALLRSEDNYIALLGGLAGDAVHGLSETLMHNYRRRDGEVFYKQVGEEQPDWVYFMPTEAVDVYVSILVRWSDGTESTYEPFGTTEHSLEADHLYWFPSGFRQNKLHRLPTPIGTDPAAYIVGYDWRLAPGSGDTWTVMVHHIVLYDSTWHNYLLFTNGAGGMETVWLRGASNTAFDPESTEFTRPRRPGHTPAIGDFRTFGAQGRPSWTMSTGWYDDPAYIMHIQQLAIADAWLVDIDYNKFLKVTVASKELDVKADDVTLFALEFTIRAGWFDLAHNG
jgi:hypothetical protein